MQTWQLHDAKAGLEEAAAPSKRDFQKFSQPKLSLGDFLDQSPMKGLDITIERDASLSRDIEL